MKGQSLIGRGFVLAIVNLCLAQVVVKVNRWMSPERWKVSWKGWDGTGGVGVTVKEEILEECEVRRRSDIQRQWNIVELGDIFQSEVYASVYVNFMQICLLFIFTDTFLSYMIITYKLCILCRWASEGFIEVDAQQSSQPIQQIVQLVYFS